LCGQYDEHLRQVEQRLGVEISNRGNSFRISGDTLPVKAAGQFIKALYVETASGAISSARVHLLLQPANMSALTDERQRDSKNIVISVPRGEVKGQGTNQKRYLKSILNNDINFGIGPAGTGKTYLAVACAVDALENERVRRIVLVRPAVEAGERLGFLPGDLEQKIDPYLRPLYDALYEMVGFERVAKLMERHVIEVAPLAYMRGRTLNDAFIILDEAQNTTVEQMKMFLTRMGFGSKAVITGDITQIDLPRSTLSGLRHVIDVLRPVDGVSFSFFKTQDVVRHPLVQRVVCAYEAAESAAETGGVKESE